MARTREQAPEHIGKDELTTMTALQTQVRAAIQQVRTSEPHAKNCPSRDVTRLLRPKKRRVGGGFQSERVRGVCTCDWAARVDARLAACVEAMLEAAIAHPIREACYKERQLAGLAAFLAAAQERAK